MASRLKRFWDVPALWTVCLCILFGIDIANIKLDENFDVDYLLRTFSKKKAVYPDSLQIITSMLQYGLKEVTKHTESGDYDGQGGQRPTPKSIDLARVLETKCKLNPLRSVNIVSNLTKYRPQQTAIK